MRKIGIIVLAISIISTVFFAMASYQANDDFDGNEAKYLEMCARTDLSHSEAATCRRFKKHLESKNSEVKNQIDNLSTEIDGLKNNIVGLLAKIKEFDDQINEKQGEIDLIMANITALEERITTRENELKERMYALQPIINGNVYIEFIMGASDFVDFLRRIEGVKAITQYDKDLVQTLLADKQALDEDRQQLEEAKDALVELQNGSITLKLELESQKEKLEVQLSSAFEVSSELEGSIANVNTEASIPPSDGGGGGMPSAGWMIPVSSGFVSAGTFYYSGTSIPHNAIDLAAPIGTPIYSPVNGYEIQVNDRCQTNNGGAGDPCFNSMVANHVILVAQVDGNVYSLEFSHNQKGSGGANGWNGQIRQVYQGQSIANIGNSGYSFGAHTHHTIINHGPNVSVTEVIQKIYRYGNYLLNLSTSYPLGDACYVKGYYPCYEKPENIYGLYVGQYY